MPGPRLLSPLLFAALAAAGCGGAPPELSRVCPDFPGTPRSRESFTFALLQAVKPENVPVPTNDAEAILFGLAYPPILESDCDGRPVAGTAVSWEGDAEAGTWTLALDPTAAFPDGTPITAAGVREMWMSRRKAASVVAPWIWDGVTPEAVEVLNDGRLLIRAPRAWDDLLQVLTQPSLALGKDNVPPWPLGARGMLSPATSFEGTGYADWIWERTASGGSGARRIAFRVMKDAAPQDVLSAGVDAFFVRKRADLAIVRELPGWTVTPYPYSRLYLLLTPEGDIAKRLDRKKLDELAALAIGDARAPKERDGYVVENGNGRSGRRTTKDRIVLPWWDQDTYAIAKRLGEIWMRASRAGVPAILPKKHTEFYRQVERGEDALYIFPVYPQLASPELQRMHILRSAPWLAERGGAVPLFETRGHLVAREGLTGFDSGYEGIPRLDGAGWSGAPAVP